MAEDGKELRVELAQRLESLRTTGVEGKENKLYDAIVSLRYAKANCGSDDDDYAAAAAGWVKCQTSSHARSSSSSVVVDVDDEDMMTALNETF